MNRPVSLFLCCLIFISSYAQKNLKKGFVVLNNHDTLTGFIDYREWYKNPSSILFSPSDKKGVQRYKMQDISCFTVTGSETYRRYTVRISMDRQTIGDISERDTTGQTDTVFLKVLQQGKNLTLFSYADDIKQRLYVLPANEDTPVELENSEYISNGEMKSEKQYRSVLLSICRRYMAGAEDVETLINTKDFTPKNISEICYRINGIDQVTVKQEKKNKPSPFRFFAGIGANRGQLSFTGDNHYTGKTDDASYGLVVDGGADIFVNPSVGRMYLRSGLAVSGSKTSAYSSVKYFEAKENYYLQLKQQNVTLIEQLNYNLYNGQSFKWFVGAGVGFNFSSYPQNEETFIKQALTDTSTSINNNYVASIRKFWLNGSFRSGFSISNLEIAVVYNPKSSITQLSGYTVKNSALQLQVNYLFR